MWWIEGRERAWTVRLLASLARHVHEQLKHTPHQPTTRARRETARMQAVRACPVSVRLGWVGCELTFSLLFEGLHLCSHVLQWWGAVIHTGKQHSATANKRPM